MSSAAKNIRLGDILTVCRQLVDPKDDNYADLPHINGAHFRPFSIDLAPANTAREDGVRSPKYLCEPGDVLYSKIRPYLRKAAFCAGLAVCSADVYPVTPTTKEVDARYLAYYLLSDRFTDYAVSRSARSRIPKLNREQLFAHELVLPPRPEQVEVADALDRELAVAADALRVATDLGNEVDGVLGASRAQLCSSLQHQPLAEVLIECRGGAWGTADDPEGVAVLRPNSINSRGELHLADLRMRQVAVSQVKALTLVDGDLIMTKSNSIDAVGNSALFLQPPEDAPTFIPSNFLQLIRVDKSKFSPTLLWHVLMSPSTKHYFRDVASGSSPSLQNLKADRIRHTPIPVLEHHDQEAWLGRLTDIWERTNKIRRIKEDSAQQVRGLMPSLVNRYFD